MRRAILMIASIIIILPACADSKSKKNAQQTSENEGASQDALPTVNDDDPTQPTDDPLFQLGMPQYCSLERDGTEGCFSCTPRELLLKRCHKILATFDAAEDCHHDLDQMACSSIEFVWNFNERSNTETMYERLPLISILIKNILASKFKDDPKKVEHASAVIDLISTHRLEIFTGKNLDQVADKAVSLFQKIRPGTAIDEAQASEAIEKVLSTLAEKTAQVDLNEGDLLQMLAGIFGQLPAELGDLVGLLEDGSLLKTEGIPDTEANQETP